MTYKTRFAVTGLAFLIFALPALASAAGLTSAQASALIGLLQAFGADQSVVLQVEQILGVIPTAPAAPAPLPVVNAPVIGSAYRSSNLGFDYSYNAPLFPPTNFGFGIVGVSGGKSFTQNSRLTQEYSWAQFGAGAPPTIYMNINAPYGSSVAGHVSAPTACAVTTVGATGDPTACAGYNYGWNAAAYALSYAKANGANSSVWWLDIEEANSWSPDTSVNDRVIQGAIDYLNSQGIRAGIYSMRYMWNNIAGTSFVPTQTINNQSVPVPNWIPIGIDTQIGALNSCGTTPPLSAGSPVWLIQYEANSTAVDQNVAC